MDRRYLKAARFPTNIYLNGFVDNACSHNLLHDEKPPLHAQKALGKMHSRRSSVDTWLTMRI
jgi:hypothetical protein